MLEEAVEVMRMLWAGDEVTHRGEYYRVGNARLYTLPEAPPPVYVSAFGPKAAEVAARIGDGFVTTAPDADLVATYRKAGRPWSRGSAENLQKVLTVFVTGFIRRVFPMDSERSHRC